MRCQRERATIRSPAWRAPTGAFVSFTARVWSPAWRAVAGSAGVEGEVVAALGAGVELARAGDAAFGVGDHFPPVGDPADGARDGEHHGEHRGRDAERAVDDA